MFQALFQNGNQAPADFHRRPVPPRVKLTFQVSLRQTEEIAFGAFQDCLIVINERPGIDRLKVSYLLWSIAAATVGGIGGTIKPGVPPVFNPELLFPHQGGNMAILDTNQVPGQPADAVAVIFGLPV